MASGINISHLKSAVLFNTDEVQPINKASKVKFDNIGEYSDDDINSIIRISKPDIAESSVKLYIKNLRLFKKLYDEKYGSKFGIPGTISGLGSWQFIMPTEDYDPLILFNDSPIATQRNYYAAILPIIRSFDKQKNQNPFGRPLPDIIQYYTDKIQLINKISKSNAENSIISDKKKEKYSVNFQQVLDLIPKLKEVGDFEGALILSLMTTFKFRNEISTLKLIKLDNYNLLNEQDKKDNNYVVLSADNNMFISRGAYKTDGTYGLIISKIMNDELKQDLINYITSMSDDIFFKSKKGKNKGNQIEPANISKRIGKITKKYLKVELGTSSITKLFVSSLDKDTMNNLIQLSKDRGTSLAVLLAHYFNHI
tara:strand:- start:161 stop:1264 length:1104 start_codon:yes stop_codon:yes gene_type:complete